MEAISTLEAQEGLIALKITEYPHVKEDTRKETFNGLNKLAYPMKDRKKSSSEEFQAMLQGMF